MSKGGGEELFDIKYETSSSNNSHETQPTSSRKVPSYSRHSGTDFLDDAFFPGLRERVDRDEAIERKHNIDTENIFDDFYFRKADLEEEHVMTQRNSIERTSFPPKNEQHGQRRRVERRREEFEPEQENQPESGLSILRSLQPPIWRMSDPELTNYLKDRVIHLDNNIVAFDKPFGLSYSGGPANRPQFDRVLQNLKALVAPNVERLHLVRSLDRNHSGVILFATNKLIQSELADLIQNGRIQQRHRCIVRGVLTEPQMNITIPLIKKVTNKDMKLVPLLSDKVKQQIFYVQTHCSTIHSNNKAGVSYLETSTTNEIPHQVRAHLSLASCPLIGDIKYGSGSGNPMRYSNVVHNLVDLSKNQANKLPMFVHLKQVDIPSLGSHGPVRIKAHVPPHFTWMLKKLHLLRK